MPLWLRSRFKKDATPSSSDNVAADPIGSNAEAAREIVHVLRELNSEMKAMKTSICKEVAGLKKSFVYNARGYAEETGKLTPCVILAFARIRHPLNQPSVDQSSVDQSSVDQSSAGSAVHGSAVCLIMPRS